MSQLADTDMERYAQDLQNLQHLSPGAHTVINWNEEGGGEVHRVNDVYVLFEVPQYGGTPNYIQTYQKAELLELVKKAYSWT